MHWKPKRIIQSWLDEIVRMGRLYISPSECMELLADIEIEEKDVWNYFFELTKDGQLQFKAVMICFHDNHSIEPTVLKEYVHFIKDDQVTIDLKNELEQVVTCATCQKETIVKTENLFGLFSPTDEYVQILKEERNNPKKND